MQNLNLIALAVPFFFALIGAELLVSRVRGDRVYRFDDAVTAMSCGVGQQVVAVFFKVALLGGYALVYDRFRVVDLAPIPALAWVVAFLGVDLAYYWWHRLSHEVAWMWAVHVVHHQSEDYNFAVALRQAWFSGLSSFPFYLPLAILGVPPLVFAASNALNTLYQFWIHTRTVGKLGPLELVINTPSHHRVHHGRDPKYLDRNYAGVLITWDRLFGSFREEDEEPRYGTIAVYESWNPVWANFAFWGELIGRARQTPRAVDKIRVFLKSPGWAPPGVDLYAPADVTAEPRIRFAPSVPRGVAPYVALQFGLVSLAAVALMSGRASALVAVPLAAWVVASTAIWGGLFERRPWAMPAELARLGATAAGIAAAAGAGLAAPWAAAAAAVVAAGCIVWVLGLRRLSPPLAASAA